MFPKNLQQILALQWDYYISRNLPIWHDELTLLYNNDERGNPIYKVPAGYIQVRVHRECLGDFYHLQDGKYGRKRSTDAILNNFSTKYYCDFLIKKYKENGKNFLSLVRGLKMTVKSWGDFFVFYGLSCNMLDITALGSKVLTNKISELLGDRSDSAEIFARYSKSKMLSPLQKLERELENLCGKKIDIEQTAKQLHKKYCWIPVSFVGEPWDVEYFVGLLGGDSKRSTNESSLRTLVRIPGVSQEAKHYLSALGVVAGLNEYRKGVFSQVSLIIRPLLDRLAKDNNLGTWKDINLLTHNEILDLLQGKNNYQKQLIEKRGKLCMMFTSGLHKVDFLYGNDVLEFEKKFKPSAQGVKEVKGIVANSGKVSGIAKIISGPSDFHKFNTNDILIAKMTSVDFIPIMKKASAFVTDEGGLACHAAVISREYGKPCIVGTRLGTVVFKDGDGIEVDATVGVVKKLS